MKSRVKTMPKGLVRDVIERDGGFCLLVLPGCMGEASTADHRSDRGHGGSMILNDGAALIAACGLCNGRKTHLSSLERLELIRRGLIVAKDSTNEKTLARCKETPIETVEGERFYLISANERTRVEDMMRGDR